MTIHRPDREEQPVAKKTGSSIGINSTADYRRYLFEYASSLVDQEIEALEALNHLSAIKKVSELMKLNPAHLTLYLEQGEEEFERVFNYAVRFDIGNEPRRGNSEI